MSSGEILGYPLPNWNSIAGWNFNAILSEFRSITGIPDASMYSDAQCATLINYYYQYVLPKELKIFWGYTYHTFFTQPDVDQYPAPANFQTLNPAAYVDGFPLEWYLSPDTFYSDYPQQENRNPVGFGTGSFNNFTFQIPAFPVLARSVYVTDGTQIAQDNGAGRFVDPNNDYDLLVGTINYVTGTVVGLEFPVPPIANANVTAVSQTFIPARPRGILFYRNQFYIDSTEAVRDSVNMFVLRPVPGLVHKIKMEGIQVPSPMINYTDVPFRADLGPLIALGAALHRFKLFNQMGQYDQYLPEYNRFKDVCMQDTYEELIYTRSVPTF